MTNWKLFALTMGAVFLVGGAVAACDEEATACETDEDCEEPELCDTEEAVCQVECASDADCDADAGETCVDEGTVPNCSAGGAGGSGGSGGCTDDSECDVSNCETCDTSTGSCQTACTGNQGCSGGACVDPGTECGSHAECYVLDPKGFCGRAEDGTQYCYDLGTTCTRASQAPPGDAAAGPILFYALQEVIGSGGDNCTKDPAACQNNGNVCQFTAGYYDPNGDIATSKGSIYSHFFFIQDGGGRVAAFDVDAITTPGDVTFRLCYPETTESLGGAVQLDDDAGHKSNATCIEGSAP